MLGGGGVTDSMRGMRRPDDLEAAYPEPRRKAAIVELTGVHEECVPALAHLLRLNAVEPTIYLNRRIKAGRPGFRGRFPELAGRVHFTRFAGRARDFLADLEVDTDLLVVNTFQTETIAAQVSAWNGPTLGVMHNAQILHGNDGSREMVKNGRVGLLTLAPHVTAHLMATDPDLYGATASVTSAFPYPPQVRARRGPGRTIALPGSVNFGSRDYQQVLDALPGILEQVGRDDVRISVVGGGGFSGPVSGLERRQRLEEEVARRGLAEVFEFAELNEHGFVPGGAYYAHLLGADFLLPAVPPDAASFRTFKITSAIPTSVGLGVPAIIDRWTATVYGVPAVVHRGGAVADGLATALAMGDDEVKDLRARLAAHKEREFARAADEMAWAMSSAGLTG